MESIIYSQRQFESERLLFTSFIFITKFGYDCSAISCTSLSEHDQTPERDKTSLPLSSSAPAFTTPNKTQAQSRNSLLGNFEVGSMY